MSNEDADESQQALVERALRGESKAFERLVLPHVAAIRRVAFAFCRKREDADDLAQEALLKAYRSLKTFRGGSLTSWLYSVTRSVCHDWYRSRKSRGQLAEVELSEELDLAEPHGPQSLLHARYESERLWGAIRQLEPKFRVPLVLFEIEGLSYEEVARIEGTPVGTIRSRLSRARKRLLALLSPASIHPTSGTSGVNLPSNSARPGK